MVYLTLKPSQTFFDYHIENKEKKFTEKEIFKELNKDCTKTKRRLFNWTRYND